MASSVAHRPTLAIALDGAEPSLVQRLMASGDMPVLASVLKQGSWSAVTSSADLGSASVWPTFSSSSEPLEHGINYVWRWNPARMGLVPEHGERIVPWWRAVALSGRRVLTLDVPFTPFAGVEGVVEVGDWGPHDPWIRFQSRPPELAEEIRDDPGVHPYHRDTAPPHDRPSRRYLARVSEWSCRGASLRGALAEQLIRRERPDLAFLVFTETHRASHLLWQTVAADDPLLAGSQHDGLGHALVDVFRSVDSAVGRILESAQPGSRIALMSLHGMRSALGVPTLLHPLLVHLGYATEPHGRRLSVRDAARMAFAATKEHSPQWVKTAWRKSVSPAVASAVAAPTALKAYDWDRTTAFCLPTDQHGWVQINLRGREARGIVPETHYAGLCREVSEGLMAARTVDGRPVVRRVLRLADQNRGRPPLNLPDLVVHWEDAAHNNPVRIAGSGIVSRPDGRRLTGKHAYEGFLIAAGMNPPAPTVAGHRLHEVIVGDAPPTGGRGPMV